MGYNTRRSDRIKLSRSQTPNPCRYRLFLIFRILSFIVIPILNWRLLSEPIQAAVGFINPKTGTGFRVEEVAIHTPICIE